MMKTLLFKPTLLTLFAVFFLSASLRTASAAAELPSSDPKAVVEFIFAKAADRKIQRNSQLQDEINRRIDFSAMAKSALGANAEKRSPQELAWFDRTLKEIITRTIYPEAPKFLESVKITYREVKQSEREAKVASVVRQRGEKTEVDYTLARMGEEWRVVDVAIDGESWVGTIADQVKRTLAKNDWRALETRLNKRLSDLKAGKKVSARDESKL